MSEQDTDPAVNLPEGVVSGESVPPDEHTLRVRARQHAEASNLRVHDATSTDHRSSTEMAEVSRRQRKRERDKRAERRAIQTILFVFVGLGGAALVGVNLLLHDEPVSTPPPSEEEKQGLSLPPPGGTGVISTSIDETPNIPAFRALSNEGLTIVAEGLPQVDALAGGTGVQALAALETCRFAYAVWEFSPNKRFRFMSTCGALDGQVMFGAYEVDGAVLRMSPLITDTDAVVSEFFVERPSRMVSRVSRRQGGPEVLTITQKVTDMKPGLDGDAWRDAFSGKNTINLPGGRRGTPPPRAPRPHAPPNGPPPAKQKSGDPLLDLLKKNG